MSSHSTISLEVCDSLGLDKGGETASTSARLGDAAAAQPDDEVGSISASTAVPARKRGSRGKNKSLTKLDLDVSHVVDRVLTDSLAPMYEKLDALNDNNIPIGPEAFDISDMYIHILDGSRKKGTQRDNIRLLREERSHS